MVRYHGADIQVGDSHIGSGNKKIESVSSIVNVGTSPPQSSESSLSGYGTAPGSVTAVAMLIQFIFVASGATM